MNTFSHHDPSPEGRHFTVAIVAVVVSLLAHMVLYQTVGNRSFALFDPLVKSVREALDKRPTPTTATLLPPTPPSLPSVDPLRTGTSGAGDGSDVAGLIDRLSSPTPASIFEPPAHTADALATPALDLVAPPPAAELPAWQPRQEILSIVDAATRDAMAPIPRRDIPAIERQRLAPDITVSYDLLAGLPAATAAAGAMPRLTSPLTVEFAPPELPAGGTEALPTPNLGPEAEGDTSTSLMAEVPEAVAPGHPLDDRLRIAVETYAPARGSDGYLYFRIDVFRKDDESLPGIPRDIVFVQDTSGSLGERYLTPCRVALREALAALRPEDRFNLIQFSHQTLRCFPDWRHPSPEALEQAYAFLDAMTAGGQTDLFASMADVLALPRDEQRPMIAVVITDGNVTAGHMERDSQIIGTFSRLNAGEVSIFTVGTSPRANVFLLDMLSYCNRGGNTEIAPDRFSVTRAVQRVVGSVAKPLLAGVRFNFDVVSAAEVYPTLTTNLYEDRPLQLFGRVRTDQPVVAFQARGNAGENRYDMLFEVDLLDPGAKTGNRTLATQWATQRMYDLVSQFARTEDPALIGAMQRLGADFGIPVPYRSRLQP